MIGTLLTKVFGSKNDRVLKQIQPLVNRINELETTVLSLDDADLAARTVAFRERLAKGEPLDDLLPESFATIREAAKRVLGERHYDVQLVGGIILHQGKIAEMKTGEGKTLTSTLPVYLNGLTGKGVHVVTVNDYLASRDAEWMGKVYTFLGMSVGKIIHAMDDEARRAAYAADVTYGTNNEFGFDYLRDNMKFELSDFCQRGFNYAIVDEVDSILIDDHHLAVADDIVDVTLEEDMGLEGLVEMMQLLYAAGIIEIIHLQQLLAEGHALFRQGDLPGLLINGVMLILFKPGDDPVDVLVEFG